MSYKQVIVEGADQMLYKVQPLWLHGGVSDKLTRRRRETAGLVVKTEVCSDTSARV